MFDESFLLSSEASKRIYSNFASDLPIIDYHCHLKPDEIYKNKKFENITDLWLKKDHYKWRLMRANGVDERVITGEGSDKEKFFAWAETIERCMGNPLYHWTHMELKTFFNIDEPLSRATAEAIWTKTNQQLGEQGLGARDFISQSNVKVIGTTDHPLSTLADHEKIAEQSFDFQVFPTFRLDNLFKVTDKEWFEEIKTSLGIEVNQFSDYLSFIQDRIEHFDCHGCKSADLGVGLVKWEPIETDTKASFSRIRAGQSISFKELTDIQTDLLLEILALLHEKSWVFQLHFGAVGSINNNAKKQLGTGTGFDMIVDQGNITQPLIYLFNELGNHGVLPKVILYNIDGTKNNVIESVLACFQENDKNIRGKMQHGPAWWFQDTLRGNRRQLEDLAEQGILMNFIGMTTDSRSFLSYVRHDYFRRILCDCLGTWIENGEMANDDELIQSFIEAVSYKNALDYFGFEWRGRN